MFTASTLGGHLPVQLIPPFRADGTKRPGPFGQRRLGRGQDAHHRVRRSPVEGMGRARSPPFAIGLLANLFDSQSWILPAIVEGGEVVLRS